MSKVFPVISDSGITDIDIINGVIYNGSTKVVPFDNSEGIAVSLSNLVDAYSNGLLDYSNYNNPVNFISKFESEDYITVNFLDKTYFTPHTTYEDPDADSEEYVINDSEPDESSLEDLTTQVDLVEAAIEELNSMALYSSLTDVDVRSDITWYLGDDATRANIEFVKSYQKMDYLIFSTCYIPDYKNNRYYTPITEGSLLIITINYIEGSNQPRSISKFIRVTTATYFLGDFLVEVDNLRFVIYPRNSDITEYYLKSCILLNA